MHTQYGLVTKNVPDEMCAVTTLAATIATTFLDVLLFMLLACQLCGRLPPQKLLKELDPLEDPSRPLVD
jgi:hypothetical protein